MLVSAVLGLLFAAYLYSWVALRLYLRFRPKHRRGPSLIAALTTPVLACGLIYAVGLGFFSLTVGKALLGWYPVRVTIELEADGRPLKISRTFECTQYMCLNDACAGSLRWRASLGIMVEKLPSDGWLVATIPTPRVCKNGPFNKYGPFNPFDTKKENWYAANWTATRIAWADDLKKLTKVQSYSPYTNLSTAVPDAEQRFSVRGMKIRYERLEWKDSILVPPVDHRPIVWFSGVYERGESTSEPLKIASVAGNGYPEDIWSRIPSLQNQLEGVDGLKKIEIDTNDRRQLEALSKAQTVELERRKSGAREIRPHIGNYATHVTFRYLGRNQWQLQSTNSEYGMSYVVGRTPLSNDQQLIIGKEHITVRGDHFIFDPATKFLIQVFGPRPKPVYDCNDSSEDKLTCH